MTDRRTRCRPARWPVVAAALALTVTSTGRAEDRPSGTEPWSTDTAEAQADEARAAQLFELGKQAVLSGRYADARRHFEASLVRVPRVSAAFNLAVAYRGLGMPVETLETLERIERGTYGAVRDDRRDEIRRLADEARREIAELEVRVHPIAAATALVRIDGQDAGTADTTRPLVVRLNPGAHGVVVQAAGRVTIDERVTLRPGERARRAFELAPLPIVDAGGPEHARGSVLRNPWFWIGVGAALTGATVATVIATTRSGEHEPVSDPTFGVTPTAITWR